MNSCSASNSAGEPYAMSSTRPPGLVTRTISRSATAWSGTSITPNWDPVTSKLSFSRSSAWASMTRPDCVGQAFGADLRLELCQHRRRPVRRQDGGAPSGRCESQAARARGHVEEELVCPKADEVEGQRRDPLLAGRDMLGVPGRDGVPRLGRSVIRMLVR